MTSSRLLWALGFGLLLAGTAGAVGQTAAPSGDAAKARPALALELNKLEAVPGACRAYFVVTNRLSEPVSELRLDTFVFDPAGAIGQRVGLTFPDLRPGRTKVVPFDLAGSGCGAIGRLLVNDVLACTGPTGTAIAGCADALATTTRTAAAFEY